EPRGCGFGVPRAQPKASPVARMSPAPRNTWASDLTRSPCASARRVVARAPTSRLGAVGRSVWQALVTAPSAAATTGASTLNLRRTGVAAILPGNSVMVVFPRSSDRECESLNSYAGLDAGGVPPGPRHGSG